jgi:hypothetical protein
MNPIKQLTPLLLSLSLVFSPLPVAAQSETPVSEANETTAATTAGNDFALSIAASEADYDPISQLTDDIIRSEIELLKLSTRYRIGAIPADKKKPWRQFAYNMGLYGTTFPGITHVSYARWRYWQRPRLASRRFLECGPTLLLIGHSIGAGGVLIETALDLKNERKAKAQGLDRKAFMDKVNSLKSDIDTKLLRRQELVAAMTLAPESKRLLETEQAVLADVRENALREVSQFVARTSRLKTARNVGNVVAMAGLTTGGYIGSLMSLIAVHKGKPKYAGPAGIGFTISGACVVLGPILSRVAGNMAARRASKRAQSELGGVDVQAADRMQQDLDSLSTLASTASVENSGGQQVQNRLAIYQKEMGIFSRQKDLAANEAKQSKKEFRERVLVNSIIGGTKMAYGIQLANAGFGFQQRQPQPTIRTRVPFGGTRLTVTAPQPKGAPQLFGHRVAQAATTFIPGTAVGLLDTLQSRIRGEVKDRSQRANKTAPGQILQRRMEELTSLEKMLGERSNRPIAMQNSATEQ